MNNINSQELARAVVTDGNGAKSGGKAATPGTQDGKVMPEAVSNRTVELKQENQAKVSEQKAQRVEQAVAKLNDYVQSLQRDLRFSVDNELGSPVVRVIDRESQEVIRQIPNETALRLARNLKDQNQVDLTESLRGNQAGVNLIDTRI